MQKLEVVVIPMNQNLNEITFLFPANSELVDVLELHPDEIFSDLSISFLSTLSSVLSKNILIRNYPDVATFAFFCRKGNILLNKKKIESESIRLGRGVVFHIAPSNVPVNFAYSMVAGILSGNVNIVRVPSIHFEQIDIICQAIEQITRQSEFSIFRKRLYLIRYDRQSTVTSSLSALCDVRVIWGGDDTISQIRQSVLPPRSFDITFADRYSIAAINADVLINETDIDNLAEGFYNDTYLFDQNACSSPRLVIWTGKEENIVHGKTLFWEAVQKKLKRYSLSSILSIDKLNTFYLQSTQCEGIQRISMEDNKLWRVQIRNLFSGIDEYRCAGGYFIEYNALSLNEIKTIINRKFQTLAYYGYNKQELVDFIKNNLPNGIDRIVPFGKTTDFGLVWDGYDLIRSLSRECVIN